MRVLLVLTVLAVLVVTSVRAEAEAEAEAVAEAGAEAGAEALPDPAEKSKTRKTPKPKGTTTMSPRDLFLMHAHHSTPKKNSKTTKLGSPVKATTSTITTTKVATTTTLPATPAATAEVETTTVKHTGKATGKTTGKSKPKPKSKGKSKVHSQRQVKEKPCKTNQKGNRKSRADCHNHNKTTVATTSTPAPAPTPSTAASNPADVSPAGDDVAAPQPDESPVTVAAYISGILEMAANEPFVETLILDKSNSTSNDALKEIRAKADLVALDSINGTIDDVNVFP